MAPKFSHRARVALSATVSTVGLAVPSLMLSATPGAAASTLCQRVSLAEVSSTLGVKATKVTTVLNGSVTLCWYKVGLNPDAVFVRSQTGTTSGDYSVNKTLAKTQGEKPVTDHHFAPYNAFSTSVGSSFYGFTYAVQVLKKSTELDVGAAKVTLAKVEALAKKVLPLL